MTRPTASPLGKNEMTKVTSSKRNSGDSSEVSMRETLNNAGNPTGGLLRPKDGEGGSLGEARTWESLQGVRQKQTGMYSVVERVCTSSRPPPRRAQEGSLGSIRREAS